MVEWNTKGDATQQVSAEGESLNMNALNTMWVGLKHSLLKGFKPHV